MSSGTDSESNVQSEDGLENGFEDGQPAPEASAPVEPQVDGDSYSETDRESKEDSTGIGMLTLDSTSASDTDFE